jgi:hypothetical protein
MIKALCTLLLLPCAYLHGYDAATEVGQADKGYRQAMNDGEVVVLERLITDDFLFIRRIPNISRVRMTSFGKPTTHIWHRQNNRDPDVDVKGFRRLTRDGIERRQSALGCSRIVPQTLSMSAVDGSDDESPSSPDILGSGFLRGHVCTLANFSVFAGIANSTH